MATPKNKTRNTNFRAPRKYCKTQRNTFVYFRKFSEHCPNIGEAVICKILYFIDFDYYEKYEEQLIGATYIKKSRAYSGGFTEIVKQMERDNDSFGCAWLKNTFSI